MAGEGLWGDCCQARSNPRGSAAGEESLLYAYKTRVTKAFTALSPSPANGLTHPPDAFVPELSQDPGGDAFNFEAFAGLCEASSSASLSSDSVPRRGLDEAQGSRRRPTFADVSHEIGDGTLPNDTFDLKKKKQLLEARLEQEEARLVHKMQEFNRKKQHLSEYIQGTPSQRGADSTGMVDALKSQLSHMARDLMQSTSSRDSVKQEYEDLQRTLQSVGRQGGADTAQSSAGAEEAQTQSSPRGQGSAPRTHTAGLDDGAQTPREGHAQGPGNMSALGGERDRGAPRTAPTDRGAGRIALSQPHRASLGTPSPRNVSFRLVPAGTGLSPRDSSASSVTSTGHGEVRRISSNGLLLRNYPPTTRK